MKNIIVVAIALLLWIPCNAQRQYAIKGQISNTEGEMLPGVTLFVPAINKGASTDNNGKFSITSVSKGIYIVQISYIGYQTVEKEVTIKNSDIWIDVSLKEQTELLDEVVVSHDKARSAQLKSSVAVAVVNSDFINENIGGSLMQSLDKLAGVSSIEIGAGQSKPVIRGLSFNRVLVAEKGLKHEGQQWGADHGLEIDQYDVQNVEILKGPGSLSFGSDAIGGVIHLKRNDFPEKNSLHGEVNTSYMSNNQSLSGSVQLEKRTNHFLFGARATGITYADYKVPTDHVNVYTLRVPLYKNRLRNTAGREHSFHLHTGYLAENFHSVFYISNYNASSGFFANAHGLEPRQVDEKLHDASRTDIQKPSQQVKHYKITNETFFYSGNHQLKLLLGFQKNIREEKGNYVNHGYMPANYPKNLSIPYDLERKFSKNFYAGKLSDKFNVNKYTFELGLDGNYQKNTIDGWGFIIPNFTQYNLGSFAIARYAINDKLKLNAGLRYDYAHTDIKKYTDWFASENTDGSTEYLTRVPDFKKKYHNVSFSAGVVYAKNQLTLKANIGNSFRMPIAKELAANGVNYHYFRYEKGNHQLKPERAYQLDIDAEWNEQNWSIELSPFINYFRNYIYLNPSSEFDHLYGAGNQIFYYTQSKVLRYGSEVHLHTKLFEHLELNAIAEYIKARQLSGSKKNYALPFSPPFNVLVNAKYTFNAYKILHKPYLSAEFKHTAKQDDIVPPEKATNGYQLLNLGMGTNLKFGEYTLNINMQVKNVFDTKYFNHTNFYRLIELPEQGRNFLVALKFEF